MPNPELPPEVRAAESLVLPLRERLPDYVKTWLIGGAISAAAGVVFGLLADPSVISGASYGVLLLGVVFLLIGGVTGGGYNSLGVGAFGTLFGSGARQDESVDRADARMGRRVRRDPRQRLKEGLRPAANPSAFWQVIGGFAYIAVAIASLSAFS